MHPTEAMDTVYSLTEIQIEVALSMKILLIRGGLLINDAFESL